MIDYYKKPISADVYNSVRKDHGEDLVVFASFSAPEGDYYGNPERARMLTEWGFEDAACPTIGCETSWDADTEGYTRENFTAEYWLCVPRDEEY